MGSTRNRATFAVVMLSAVVLAVTACSSGSTSQSSSTSGASSSAGVDHATAQLAAASGLPTFTAPGPAFDISKVKGKSIFVIPAADNEFDGTIQTQMKALADQYGVKYTACANQGTPNEWVSCFNTGLSQNPDLIVLNSALDPNQVKAQMALAKAKNIPVLATHFFDEQYSQSLNTACGGTAELCDAGLTGTVNAPFDAAVKLMADYVISKSNGQGHALVISANDAAPSAGMVSAIQQEFTDNCPGCTVDVQNVAVADWSTKVQPLVQAELAKDPKLSYVLPIFDFGASFAQSGINIAGKQGKAEIVSYNGTPNVLQQLQAGSAVTMDVGEPLNWLGYAFMDQAFRLLAGVAPVPQNTPIRVFTSTNIADAGNPPTADKGYGDAYIKGYTDLWTSGN
jgi:ribose transport system substrate-binding protein